MAEGFYHKVSSLPKSLIHQRQISPHSLPLCSALLAFLFTAKPCMACQKLLFCCPRSLDTLSCTHSPALAAAECRGLVSEVGSVSAQGWKGKHTATETRWRAEKVTHLVGTVGLMWGPLAVLLSLYAPPRHAHGAASASVLPMNVQD